MRPVPVLASAPLVSALLASVLLLCATSHASAAAPLPHLVERVRALVISGDSEAAAEAAHAAVEALPGNALAWWWAGRAYGIRAMQASLLAKPRWAGRTREAFERAVALDPAHLDARLDLMGYYRFAPGMLGGGADKAAAQARDIAGLDASMGRFAAALLALDAEDEAGADAALREALALDGDNQRARMLVASRAAQREDWAAVRAVWNEQLARGTHQATARYQLGRCAALSGEELAQGLAHIERFIADGEVTEELSIGAAHWRRGQVLEKLGRGDEALAAWTLALADEQVRDLAEADIARVQKP